MSRNLCAGLLEGTHRISQDMVAEKRFEGSAVGHIRMAPQQIVDIQLQSCVLEQSHGTALVQLHKDVDIALIFCLTSGHGTEDSGMVDTIAPQLAFMRAQYV